MTRVSPETDSTTVTEAVTRRLREEIESGRLDPGQRLIQAHVAADYGVSTTPVRESFVKLELEGLLVNSSHRGVVVFKPTTKDMTELYEIRIPLEAAATELAVPNLTDRDLAALRDALEGMRRAGEEGDIELRGSMNEKFHVTIYTAADRPRLLRMIESLRGSSRAYLRRFRGATTGKVTDIRQEHEAIYEACAAGSPEDAVAAMTAHLRHTVAVLAADLDGR